MLSEFHLPPAKRKISDGTRSLSPPPKKESVDLWEGTTWLQPVPFVDIDKDEKVEILEFIKVLMEDHLDGVSQHTIDSVTNYRKLVGVDPGEDSKIVGPVLQLHSVTISNQFDGTLSNNLQIFGEISVRDDKNNIFYIYKREEENPEQVTCERNQLFLNCCTIPPVMGGKVKVMLTNKGSGRQILDGSRDIEKSSIEDDEGKFTLVFDGQDGYRASIVFTKILFASIAKIEIYSVDHTCSMEGTSYKVYGTIKVNDVVCFQKKSEEAVEMVHGECEVLHLSRCVFAVPVFTPAVVEIELFNGEHEEIANDKVKLNYPHYSFWPTSLQSDITCKDERYCFGIYEDWILHDDYFRGSSFGVWMDNLKVEWSSRAGQISLPFLTVTSDHLVEVFSICIAGGDSSAPPLLLCGTIVVRDEGGTVYVFSRYKNLPDKLSLDERKLRPLSLAWPVDRWIRLEDFFMHLKLQDECGNRVSRGTIHWRADIATRYDVRLCDVIQGENGYFAAVHYSVFKDGSKAKVSIKWEGPANCLVYGSVVAQYKNYVYPSSYEEDYYKSIIFKRSEEDGVWVKRDSEIPLSKSHVSAPSDCEGLIIHVKLRCLPVTILKPLEIVDEHLFEARSNATRRQMGCMSVNVEWFARSP